VTFLPLSLRNVTLLQTGTGSAQAQNLTRVDHVAFGSPFIVDSDYHPPATFFPAAMLLSVSPAWTV
jgi:hypothetical protein